MMYHLGQGGWPIAKPRGDQVIEIVFLLLWFVLTYMVVKIIYAIAVNR